jgi:hypothetical protein
MLRVTARSAALIGGIALALSAFAASPSPAPASAAARPVPIALQELCAHEHISCDGRWTHLGGREVYKLSTHFAITGRGKIRPRATGCWPFGNNYCTTSNVASGKCWSDNSQSGNGVPLVLNNCDPASYGQDWQLIYPGLGGSGISWEVANTSTPECMNDPYGTNASGTQQQLWACYATKYEDYGYQNVGPNGSQYLLAVDGENPGSSGDACLSDNGDTSSGAPLLIESCNGSTNQRWYYA